MVQNRLFILCFSLCVLFFVSCDDKEGCPAPMGNTGEIIEDYYFSTEKQNDTADCTIYFPEPQMVIRTQEELDLFESGLNWAFNFDECDSIAFDSVNFEDYSLIGKIASGYGCSVYFDKDVTFNETEKTVVYTIHVLNCGSCNDLRRDMFFVKVPPIPEDWFVSFQLRNSKYQEE